VLKEQSSLKKLWNPTNVFFEAQ